MNRAESLEWINAFVAELGGTPIKGTEAASPGKELTDQLEMISKKPEQSGMEILIAGCSGFEIGSRPKEAHTNPVIQKNRSVSISSKPDVNVVRKAIAGVNDKPLLLSLLEYYLFELRQEKKNRSMMKTTKEQIMKHWPMLTLSPLINALDGAVAE